LAVAAGAGYGAWLRRRRRQEIQETIARNVQPSTSSGCCGGSGASTKAKKDLHIRILFGSVTGTSKAWAEQLADDVSALSKDYSSLEVSVEDLATFPFDNILTPAKPKSGCCSAEAPQEAVVVLLSTAAGGVAPENCDHFVKLLVDHAYDFRVGSAALSHLGFAVLGFGSDSYPAGQYCTVAEKVDEMFAKMSASRLVPLKKVTDTQDSAGQVQPWFADLLSALSSMGAKSAAGEAKAQGGGCCSTVKADADADEDDIWSSSDESEAAPDPAMEDMEELNDSNCGNPQAPKDGRKDMLTTRQKAQLTKEGYKIIGTHSAVKLCRWTKHQLRGRGACYKHSFYGITSSQCMEATPSLACANKCVFCWRHHKNPTATEWKWAMDDPEEIVREAIEKHQAMIRECKGIPGVMEDRFKKALTPQHCALSLVGEPSMYPRINEMCGALHKQGISTFMVTNAQFPDAIKALCPVTQLYVSVDAATRDALKAVDRPLFSDFWERFLDSLRALKHKKQRTVYRLTLVRDQNMKDPQEYAKLVALGEPDFLEIKSVTFCGESKASDLTMGNVPWHEEVKQFTEAILAEEGLGEKYELACEHQHSCITLLAHKRFKVNGEWQTWINYDKFHELVRSGKDFDALDYAAPTPLWAYYGSDEAGFDPKETRVYHNRTVKRAKAGLLSEAQLRHYPTDPALSADK
jgi:tRNA wybutosine-synthesizing protein 1